MSAHFLRCTIVDDDELSRRVLQNFIEQTQTLQLVGCFDGPAPAFDHLQNGSTDLVFLDIEMPEMTGIQLLETLRNPPAVVITSSKLEYALDGYRFGVIDYLLKPITPARFFECVNRVSERIEALRTAAQHTERLDPQQADDRLFIRRDNQFIPVNFSRIQYVEAAGNYVRLVTQDGEFMLHTPLAEVEARLPQSLFVRVHRSYIVNLQQITLFQGNFLAVGNKPVPVSKNHQSTLETRLNLLK